MNYKKIYDKSKIILDLRNKYKKDKLNKIIKFIMSNLFKKNLFFFLKYNF